MTKLELLIDFHLGGERQGPGSTAETKKALNHLGIDKNQYLKVADIGCGTGSQTFTLAQNLNGQIIAVDVAPDFLDKINMRIKELSLEKRISTLNRSMENLPFKPEEFDLIWSEGAIYNMGYEEGIRRWRKFLKSGGYLAVSEISWITNSRPHELEVYWRQIYKQIDTISNKIAKLEQNGYSPVAHFVLPQYCWTENFYQPMQSRFEPFLQKHGHSAGAHAVINEEKQEIEHYEEYKEFYGYVFYIAQKIN